MALSCKIGESKSLHWRFILLCILLPAFAGVFSSCVAYHHFREFKPVDAYKIEGKEDLHSLLPEHDLHYRLLVLAIPLERKCVDYSWRTTRLSKNRYYLDYTFWNFSDDSIDVSVSEIKLILDEKDTLDISDSFEQTWITAYPYDRRYHSDDYFVIARNGLHNGFYDIAPVLKTDGVYAATATEYYSDENGFEIPPGANLITAITIFHIRIGDETQEIESVLTLRFRDGKKLGIFF